MLNSWRSAKQRTSSTVNWVMFIRSPPASHFPDSLSWFVRPAQWLPPLQLSAGFGFIVVPANWDDPPSQWALINPTVDTQTV